MLDVVLRFFVGNWTGWMFGRFISLVKILMFRPLFCLCGYVLVFLLQQAWFDRGLGLTGL